MLHNIVVKIILEETFGIVYDKIITFYSKKIACHNLVLNAGITWARGIYMWCHMDYGHAFLTTSVDGTFTW